MAQNNSMGFLSESEAKAACEDGVAAKPITDWNGYRAQLRERMSKYW